MWWAHSVDEAGGIGQMRGRGEERENPKVRKAEREAGHQLETAAICSVALGLRSGWGWKARRPGSQPRPVSSATRARPWPMSPFRGDVEAREAARLGRRSQKEDKATGGETCAGLEG